MEPSQLVFALVVAAVLGIVATIAILRRQRRDAEIPAESPFAVSSEGMKRCPKCGQGNLWTDTSCMSCGSPLKG